MTGNIKITNATLSILTLEYCYAQRCNKVHCAESLELSRWRHDYLMCQSREH
jgi:hypothetical protein